MIDCIYKHYSYLIIPWRNIMVIRESCKLLQILSVLITFLVISDCRCLLNINSHQTAKTECTHQPGQLVADYDTWITWLGWANGSLKCDDLPFMCFKLLRYRDCMSLYGLAPSYLTELLIPYVPGHNLRSSDIGSAGCAHVKVGDQGWPDQGCYQSPQRTSG